MAFLRFVGKTCGFIGYALQTACVTHCTFEYVGDFVMVSWPTQAIFPVPWYVENVE